MPRDGSNVYSLPEAPFQINTVASPSSMNNNLSDLAAAMTDSVCRSTETTTFSRTLLDDASASVARATLVIPVEMIERKTASASSVVDFVLPAGYTSFEVRFERLRLSADNTPLWFRASTNSGVSYLAGTEYAWAATYPDATAVAVGGNANGAAQAQITGAADNTATDVSLAGVIHFDVGSATIRAQGVGQTVCFDAAAGVMLPFNVGFSVAAGAAVNALRIMPASGNIASGTITLYGHR